MMSKYRRLEKVCPICFEAKRHLSNHMRTVHVTNCLPVSMAEPVLDLTFQHAFRMIISGPSGSGKTTWVQNLIQKRNELIVSPPRHIEWRYKFWQNTYEDLMKEGVKFVEGLGELHNVESDTLLIIDDHMEQLTSEVEELFTKGSRHRQISVILIVQNMFWKNLRTISLNAEYVVIFRNPRDAQQVRMFIRQMFHTKASAAIDAYEDATQKSHGYILFDASQNQNNHYRLRTDIFNEHPIVYYI